MADTPILDLEQPWLERAHDISKTRSNHVPKAAIAMRELRYSDAAIRNGEVGRVWIR